MASPEPKRILRPELFRWLIECGALVIAADGRGIPAALAVDGHSHHGVEAVFLDWGVPQQREIGRTSPQALARLTFASGSMTPKVRAACAFVLATGRRTVIGSLEHMETMLASQSGTQVCIDGPTNYGLPCVLPNRTSSPRLLR